MSSNSDVARFAFVPGIFGTKLRLDGREIWSNRKTVLSTLRAPQDLLDSDVDPYDVFETFEFASFEFLTDRIKIPFLFTGGPASVYLPLLEKLRAGSRVDCFPFNWTNSAIDLAPRLNQWLASNDDGTPWIIIAHSFGGLVLSAYLSLAKRKKVDISSIILCGVPLLGSARSLGWAFGIDDEIHRLLRPLWKRSSYLDESQELALRKVLLQMGSIRDLLPMPPEKSVYLRNGTYCSIDQLPNDLRGETRKLWEKTGMSQSAVELRDRWEGRRNLTAICKDLHISLSCVLSICDPITPSALRFPRRGKPDYADGIYGDGVVTSRSASAGVEDYQRVIDAEHSELPTSSDFLNFLEELGV